MLTLDELTVWLLFISAALALIAIGVLIYACALLLEVQQKIRHWPPEVERTDEWPRWRGRL